MSASQTPGICIDASGWHKRLAFTIPNKRGLVVQISKVPWPGALLLLKLNSNLVYCTVEIILQEQCHKRTFGANTNAVRAYE